jgi:hypothetical protein
MMGFSPSQDLMSVDGKRYHLEKKDGPRIVLWNQDESRVILELTMASWERLKEQLEWLPEV